MIDTSWSVCGFIAANSASVVLSLRPSTSASTSWSADRSRSRFICTRRGPLASTPAAVFAFAGTYRLPT